ncbi:MAG: hypothetical protein IKG80_02750 [Clostridia bacterium]|nr:hypothetical protein [Clostridia bacterium]
MSNKNKDPMRGNLDTPWLYFIIWLFCIVFLVTCIIFCVYRIFTVQSDLALRIIRLVFLLSAVPVPILGIIVGRYPEKFPVEFRRVFYRDDAWSIYARIRNTAEKNKK